MSRRGCEGAPADDVLLRALDLLVESEGIVEAGERLGVNYRTAAGCYESRHVSRKMRGVLAGATGPDEPVEHETGGGEESRLQEPDPELRREVEALRAEVVDLRERVDTLVGFVSEDRGTGGDNVDMEDVDTKGDGKQQRSAAPPRRIFPELITELAEPGEELVYGAAAELIVEWREAWAARRSARYTMDWLRAERRGWNWSCG